MFQSFISNEVTGLPKPSDPPAPKVTMPHPGQIKQLQLAAPNHNSAISPTTVSPRPASHMASPRAAAAVVGITPAVPLRHPASNALRIHIPENRSFPSPCPSPTGTIR